MTVGDLIKLNELTAIGYPETNVRDALGIIIETLPIHGMNYHTILFPNVNKEREFPQHQLELVSESR
jgi:hypothetical protein